MREVTGVGKMWKLKKRLPYDTIRTVMVLVDDVDMYIGVRFDLWWLR